MSMRRVLAPVLPVVTAGVLVLTLAGCGDDTGGSAASPSPTSSSTSSPASSSSADPSPTSSSPATLPSSQVVELVSETAAGGTVGDASALPSADAVMMFTDQFRNATMSERLTRLFQQTTPPAGTTLYAAVVAIGCEPPTDVTVTIDPADRGLVVTAVPTKKTQVECLAPVTTVAVLTVPSRAVGPQITHGPVVDGAS